MKHKLRKDRFGVESVPLKLIVVALILALIIPSFLIGLTSYSNSQAEVDIKGEIDRIISTVKQASSAEEGSLFKLSVNFQDGITRKVDYVLIGDRIGEHGGPWQSTIRYKFQGESNKTVIIDNPNVMTTSPINAPLEMGSGKYNLVVEKYEIAGIGFVVVRFENDNTRFRICEIGLSQADIVITNNLEFEDKWTTPAQLNPDGLNPGLFTGLIVYATIHNYGNAATNESPWPPGTSGKVKVRFFDNIPLKNETRSLGEDIVIDYIPAGGFVKVNITKPWVFIEPGDDYQDPELLVRDLVVVADCEDGVDELSGENNMARRQYVNEPPVVTSVKSRLDDPARGIGTFVVSVYAENTLTADAFDPDARVQKVMFIHYPKSYPENKYDPNHLDYNGSVTANFRDPREFEYTLDMGQFPHTTPIFVKALDNVGCGSDPFRERIYMEIMPEWMKGLKTKANAETGIQDFLFNTSTNPFGEILNMYNLFIEFPGSLMDGFAAPFKDMPYIDGTENEMENPSTIQIDIPLGTNASFQKNCTFNSGIMGKGGKGNVTLSVELFIGLDESLNISLPDVFELVSDMKELVYHWEDYKDILTDLPWDDLKNPLNYEALHTALLDAYQQLGQQGMDDYQKLRQLIYKINVSIEMMKDVYDELKDLWDSLMNFKDDPASILKLVKFKIEATYFLPLYNNNWTLFEAEMPIFPPLVTAEVSVKAGLNLNFNGGVKFDGDLTGLNFSHAWTQGDITAWLEVTCSVKVGVNLGIAGGGIKGSITGRPELEIHAGFNYNTTDGFSPIFNGAFRVILEAALSAYIEFLFWTKEWTFYKGNYTLGEWTFDLVGGSTTKTNDTTPTQLPDPNSPGNIVIPAGPVEAFNSNKTRKIEVKSKNWGPDLNNTDYEIIYKYYPGPAWSNLTSTNKIPTNPKVAYNNTNQTFIVWSEWSNYPDMWNVTTTINDYLRDSDIYYAILNGTTVVQAPILLHNATPNIPDFAPAITKLDNGSMMVTWKRDLDGNVYNAADQHTYYSIWNGTNWSEPAIHSFSHSIDYGHISIDLGDGRILTTWISDEDMSFFTTTDQELEYNIYSGGTWSEPVQLTNDGAGIEHISMASNGDDVILVWLSRNGGVYQINSKTWNKATDVWSSTEVINTTSSHVESPQVAITDNGIAVVTWKGHHDKINLSNPEEGWIYVCTRDLNDDTGWTAPRKLTTVWAEITDFTSFLDVIDEKTLSITFENLSGPPDNPNSTSETRQIELRPDLYLNDVNVEGVSNFNADEGSTVQIKASLSNPGDIAASSINVSFYDGDPSTGGVLIHSAIIPNLQRMGSTEVVFDWTVEEGIHNIYVIMDPNDVIIEHEEMNNKGFCTVTCVPDLKITTQDISFSSTLPDEGETVQVTASVHNKGHVAASSVQVNFFNGNPNQGGTLIKSESIASIGINDNETVTVNWVAVKGTSRIFVQVSCPDELNLGNNLAPSFPISVLPDLKIAKTDYTVSKTELLEGEQLTLSATIHNTGSAGVTSALVKFYSQKGILIEHDMVTISKDGSALVTANWAPPLGVHLVFVEVDPGNTIKELNEANNIQQITVTVYRTIDLTVNLQLEKKGNDKVTITATIPNNGVHEASKVKVEIYDGAPGYGGVLINSTTISQIAGGSQSTITLDWETSKGLKNIYAVVDSMDLVTETDETNNVQSKSVQMGAEKGEEGSPLLLVVLVIVLIAVPVVIILFWWRKRLH